MFDFKDVYILPQYSTVASRSQVDTTTSFDMSLDIPVPVISANMDTVTDSKMAIAMWKAGGIGAIHRFMSIEENLRQFSDVIQAQAKCFVSIGVNADSRDRFNALWNAGANYFIIDIAHGHSIMMKDMVEWIRTTKGSQPYIMAGNVATRQGTLDLFSWGADAVKIGIGPGCFAAGTRVLMANGQYKNIEKIKPGEKVINKDGVPAVVKNAFSTGFRSVVKYRTNVGIGHTICTPDHKHFIGNLSSSSKASIESSGYKHILDKKTRNKQSKFQWSSIEEASKINSVCLVPKNIVFEIPETFTKKLFKRSGGNRPHNAKYLNYISLTPSYEMGYIFGTFLGDGTAHCTVNKKNNSHSGTVSWTFGSKEIDIVEKLNKSLEKVFNKSLSAVKQKNNIICVAFCDKPFADFLNSFGKRNKKNLPAELFVNNLDYLNGLHDGLVDSDGHITKEFGKDRVGFKNTSKQLVELFSILTFKLKGHFPNICEEKPSVGGLQNCNLKNCNLSWKSQQLISPNSRIVNDFQIVKIMEYDTLPQEVEVFDLEIDDETHSFVANNVIVHNSACLTKNVTGVTKPQFSAIADVFEDDIFFRGEAGFGIRQKFKTRTGRPAIVVADGGVKEIGDVAKAIGAGANAVMCGSMFAACKEAPGERINGKKIYRGNASRGAMLLIKDPNTQLPTPEGTSILLEESEQPVEEVVRHIKGGLQSAFSYSNARNIEEFQNNVIFESRK